MEKVKQSNGNILEKLCCNWPTPHSSLAHVPSLG